jgi:hypothetical protein
MTKQLFCILNGQQCLKKLFCEVDSVLITCSMKCLEKEEKENEMEKGEEEEEKEEAV